MFDWRWPAFFTRVTAGSLFGMAGVHKVFVMTPPVHARKLFLEPYQRTWIPDFLLWFLDVGIPFLELIGGWLLVAGYLRRLVAVSLGLLLLAVTYGHALLEPLFNVNSPISQDSCCCSRLWLYVRRLIPGLLTQHSLGEKRGRHNKKSMSVPYLRDATSAGETDKLIRFVRLHLGDGNEETGRKEIDKSWAEAVKILLRYDPVDESAIARILVADESTLALLYFHLHFYLIRKSGEWIHDGSR